MNRKKAQPWNVRDWLDLAKATGTTLELRWNGGVFIEDKIEPSPDGDGGIFEFGSSMQFVGPCKGYPRGGWEYYADQRGKFVGPPSFVTEDGDTLTLEQILAKVRGEHEESAETAIP